MQERKLPDDFLEKLMIKGAMKDDFYVASLASTFNSNYFDDEWISKVYQRIIEHFREYNKIPPKDLIVNSFEDKERENVATLFEEIDSIDYNVADNFDHLFEESNLYLKEQAFKDALARGVDLVEQGKNPLEYKNIIEDALTKDLKIDLGVNYWSDLTKRLTRILSKTDVRIPTFFPILDEFIVGGFPPYTLSVFLSRIHGYKCVGKDTKIKIRKKSTDESYYARIEDIWDSFKNKNEIKLKESKMIPLEKMKEKYGDEEGERRYFEWKRKISESSKGRNTLDFFIKKYGEEEGRKRHDVYIQKQKESNSEIGYKEVISD